MAALIFKFPSVCARREGSANDTHTNQWREGYIPVTAALLPLSVALGSNYFGLRTVLVWTHIFFNESFGQGYVARYGQPLGADRLRGG